MSAYLAVGRLAPLAGPPRPRLRRRVLAGRATRRSTSWSPCSCRSAGSPGRRTPTARPVNRTRCSPARSSIFQSLRAGVALAELLDDAAAGVGARRRPARPRAARAPRPVPGQVDVLDGLVLPGARRRRPRRRGARRCSTRAGTTSWCPASASAASTPTRGSPAPRPASWRWRSTRSATRTARCGCSRTCSTCATTTAATGPATSSPTRRSGRSSTRRTPPPR